MYDFICSLHVINYNMIMLSVPTFQFNATTYTVTENMGSAVVTIELIDKMLHFDIAVSVVDVAGGTATGELQHGWNCYCKTAYSLYE